MAIGAMIAMPLTGQVLAPLAARASRGSPRSV